MNIWGTCREWNRWRYR